MNWLPLLTSPGGVDPTISGVEAAQAGPLTVSLLSTGIGTVAFDDTVYVSFEAVGNVRPSVMVTVAGEFAHPPCALHAEYWKVIVENVDVELGAVNTNCAPDFVTPAGNEPTGCGALASQPLELNDVSLVSTESVVDAAVIVYESFCNVGVGRASRIVTVAGEAAHCPAELHAVYWNVKVEKGVLSGGS